MAITNATTLAQYAAGIGTQGSVFKIDNADKAVGIGTTDPSTTLTVGAVGASGTSIYVHGDGRVTGVITATTFIGALTGNVTGDASGTAGGLSGTPTIAVDQLTANTYIGVSSASGVPGINTGGHSVLTTVKASGITTISNTTASTSITTGALIITGGVGIAKSLFVGEGVSVAGTITYQDVSNVDSTGIVTAGKGLRATTGGLHVVAGVSTLGALLETNAAGAKIGTGASIHQPATNVLTLGTNNTEKARITSAGGILLNNGTLVERVNRNTSAAANAATALNLDDGMVHWFTTNLGAANVKMNVVSGAGINTTLATGDMISVTIMTAVNSTSNFIEQLRVDGVEGSAGVTTYWAGGSAPDAGGGSGVDTYAFNIVKTGNATYDMIANQVKGS